MKEILPPCSATLQLVNVIYWHFLQIIITNHLIENLYGVFVENELFKKIVNLI